MGIFKRMTGSGFILIVLTSKPTQLKPRCFFKGLCFGFFIASFDAFCISVNLVETLVLVVHL